MSEFLAEAQILVIPNTKGFAAALKIQLEKATEKPVPVTVVPSTVGFAAALREQLAAVKTSPIPVRAVPITTGFKAALTTAINEIKAAPVDVQIVPNVAGFATAVKAATSKVETTPVPVTIVPNTSGFAAALKAETEAVAATPVPVLITPDTAAFSALLREQTQAAGRTPVGVPVVPEIAGFASALRTETQAVTKTPVKVPVIPTTVGFTAAVREETQAIKVPPVKVLAIPDLVGFSAALRAKIAETATLPVKVLAVPDLTGFAAALQTAVAAAASTVTAVVTVTPAVTPVAPGSASTGAGATVLTQEAAAAEAAAAAVEKLTAAERAAQTAEAGLVKAAERYTAANTIRISEDNARAVLARQLRDVNAGLADIEGIQTAAIQSGNVAIQERVAFSIAALQQTKAEIASRQASIKLAAQQVAVLNSVAEAQAREAVAKQEVIGASTPLAALERKLSLAKQASKIASDALAASEGVLTGAELELAVAVEASTRALVESLAAEKALERAALKTAAAQGFAARGFLATAAAALGLRGAALAANTFFIGGAVAAIAFGKSVKSAADFQSDLATFNVVAGATADEMERVSAAAQQLGQDVSLPGVTASDAADAMLELSKAGLSVQDSLSGARGVLQLATAAQISNADATQIAASALNAFGLAGDQAVHVADVLTNAANESQGAITDVGIALQQASAVARQVGISFKDTVTFLTLLQKNGIKGSDAGTSLRVAFTRLINPTDKAAEVLKKLGVQIRDSAGNIRPAVFRDFAAAQATLTKKQQDANAAIVFGTDALRAYSIIAREGLSGFTQVSDALDKQGTASAVANARMTGLTGAASNLSNQVSALGLTVGTLLVPPLSLATAGLALFFGDINKGIQDLEKLVGGIGGLAKGFKLIKDAIAGTGGPKFDPSTTNIQDLTDRLVELNKERKDFEDSGSFVPPTLSREADELSKKLAQVAKAGLATGTSTGFERFVKVFTTASPQIKAAIQDGIITPLEKSQLEGTALGKAFITALPKDAFTTLAQDASAGLEDLNATTKSNLAAVISGIDETSRLAGLSATDMGNNIVDKLAAALAKGVSRVKGAIAGLQRQALDIEIAGGGPQQQLANARQQEAAQRKNVALREKQLAAGDISNETVTRAKQALVQAIQKRKGLEAEIQATADQAETDRKNAAEKAKTDRQKKQNDADQALLDSFFPAENRLDIAGTIAQGANRLKDILKIDKARKAQLLVEIKAIDDDFNDRKKAAQLIGQKRVQIAQLTTTITADTKAIFDAALQPSPTFVAQQNLAAATGNIPQQIALNKVRIAQINTLIKVEHAKGEALNNLKTERENLRKANEALQDQQVQDDIALAQSIFDLTGKKGPLLKALNAAIAETNADIAAAKKAGRSITKLKTELNGFLKQRKDLLDKAADDSKKSTTAFDLLKEFNARFGEIAGNLITPDQPFAGGSAFTTDIVNKGIANFRPTPGAPLFPGKTKDDKLVASQTALTDAIRELTEVTQRASGNVSTADGKKGGPGTIAKWSSGAWWSARQAREVRDG